MTSKHSKLKTEIKLFHFSQDGLISISGSTTVHMTILKVDCVLFLTDVEKERLGAFVRAPFRNYNKSKELLDDHEKRAFHKTSMERASCTQSQQTNTESRIDVSINQISVENFKQNKALLPSINCGCNYVLCKATNCISWAQG